MQSKVIWSNAYPLDEEFFGAKDETRPLGRTPSPVSGRNSFCSVQAVAPAAAVRWGGEQDKACHKVERRSYQLMSCCVSSRTNQ